MNKKLKNIALYIFYYAAFNFILIYVSINIIPKEFDGIAGTFIVGGILGGLAVLIKSIQNILNNEENNVTEILKINNNKNNIEVTDVSSNFFKRWLFKKESKKVNQRLIIFGFILLPIIGYFKMITVDYLPNVILGNYELGDIPLVRHTPFLIAGFIVTGIIFWLSLFLLRIPYLYGASRPKIFFLISIAILIWNINSFDQFIRLFSITESQIDLARKRVSDYKKNESSLGKRKTPLGNRKITLGDFDNGLGKFKGIDIIDDDAKTVTFNDDKSVNSNKNNRSNIPKKKINYNPKKAFYSSPSSFWFKDQRYSSYKVISSVVPGPRKRYIQEKLFGEIGLLQNGGGIIRLGHYQVIISGTLTFYLSNGKSIKCFDRKLREKVNSTWYSYYFLTKNELKTLIDNKINVEKIKYNIGDKRIEADPIYSLHKSIIDDGDHTDMLRKEIGI